MAKKIINAQMKQRRDTKANWAANNPVLLAGELGIVSDDPNLYKVGDGTTAWNALPFRGFDGTLVHTTGDSETAVMSQKAVTEKLTPLSANLGVLVNTSYLSQTSDMYNYIRVPFKQGDKVSISNQSDGAMSRHMLIFDEQGNTNIAIPLNSQDVEVTIPRNTSYIALYAYYGGVTQEGEVILTVKPISGLEYRVSHLESETNKINKSVEDIDEGLLDVRSGISALRINIIDGIYINNGGIEFSNSAFSSTDYIAVNEGGRLKLINCINIEDSGVAVVSFYDKDKICRRSISTITYPIDELITFDIPNGISYVRISFRTAKKRYFYCYVDHVYSIEKNASKLSVVEAFPYNYAIGEDGYYISSSSGVVIQHDAYSISEYIPIVSNILSYKGMLFSAIAYALYDYEKNVVGLLTTNSSSLIEVEGEIDILKDYPTAVYLRVTWHSSDYKPIIRHKGSRIPIPFVHDEESNYISGWKDNCYIDGNGEEVSYNGLFASEKVFLKPRETYYHSGLYGGYYAFYDTKGGVIESHGISEPIPNPLITPLGTSYARFTCANEEQKNEAWIYTEKKVPNPYRNTISEKFLPLRLQDKIFCDFDGNDISLFNRGICIGDSLTQGTMNYEKENGATGYINMSQYAYPKHLQKLTGVEIVNEGIGGTTSFEWFELKKNADLSGFDFAIIQMGVNDAIRNMENYDTPWSEDSRQGFSNIINKLKTENPKIKIFVSTIIPGISYSSQQYIDICEDIRDYVLGLVDNNVILLDMQIYGNTKDSVAYNCGHLSAYGYWRLAKDYQSIISYYINTHKEEFREVQFIGTDYHYS